jgi:hypothetical protein
MPVHIIWEDDAKTIARCTGEGQWTWDEYHNALSQIVEDFKLADQRVDLIIHRVQNASMPPGSPMPHFQRAMRIMPRNVGLVLLINTNTFARALVSMFSRIFTTQKHAKLVMVGSLDEAHQRIQLHRANQIYTDVNVKAS